MKKNVTRLKLHADQLNIHITIETVGQRSDDDVVVTFPRSSDGRQEAIEFARDWRTQSERKGNAIGEKSSNDVACALEALEIEQA